MYHGPGSRYRVLIYKIIPVVSNYRGPDLVRSVEVPVWSDTWVPVVLDYRGSKLAKIIGVPRCIRSKRVPVVSDHRGSQLSRIEEGPSWLREAAKKVISYPPRP